MSSVFGRPSEPMPAEGPAGAIPVEGSAPADVLAGGSRSRRRRPTSWGLVLPASVLVFMMALSFLGPLVLPLEDPSGGELLEARLPVLSDGHLLGTDSLGNDLLSRAIYGGRVSFMVGVAAVFLALAVGGVLGVISGYSRGLLGSAVMRVVDVMLSIPSLVLAVALAAYLGPSLFNVIIAIGIFIVPANARLAHAATRRVLAMEYVAAAELQGKGRLYIGVRHVIPNMTGEMVTYNIVNVATAMIIESALSFLGVGVRPPTPSWGSMISEGANVMTQQPNVLLVPAAFLFVAVLSVNLTGDALRQWWEAR